MTTERECRVCGCTNTHACEVLSVPCCWVTEDLCSGCASLRQLLHSEDAGVPWLFEVLGEYSARELMLQEAGVRLRVRREVPVVWRNGA